MAGVRFFKASPQLDGTDGQATCLQTRKRCLDQFSLLTRLGSRESDHVSLGRDTFDPRRFNWCTASVLLVEFIMIEITWRPYV